VFVQVALPSQGVLVAHSSMSVHVTPSPWKPSLHLQVKLPGVFVQAAFVLQLEVPAWHSSTSRQFTPSPV
jgi:hypothetical protein